MRSNMLNKAMNVVDDKNMPVKLQEIRKDCDAIMGNYPAKRAELAEKLEAAQRELRTAKAAKDAAEDLTSYDKAEETVIRAELKVKFAAISLEKLEAAPRMEEADYYDARNLCQKLYDDAVLDYRSKAEEIMDQLKGLHDGYLNTVRNINNTLIYLDEAANILQTKQLEKDWTEYALRFFDWNAEEAATFCTGSHELWQTHDSLLSEAWRAVTRGYPRHNF